MLWPIGKFNGLLVNEILNCFKETRGRRVSSRTDRYILIEQNSRPYIIKHFKSVLVLILSIFIFWNALSYEVWGLSLGEFIDRLIWFGILLLILFPFLYTYLLFSSLRYMVSYVALTRGAIMFYTSLGEKLILGASEIVELRKLNTTLPFLEIIYRINNTSVISQRKFMINNSAITEILQWWKENRAVDPVIENSSVQRFKRMRDPFNNIRKEAP